MSVNLLNLSRAAIAEFVKGAGGSAFHLKTLSQWVHQRYVTDFDEMPDFSKSFRQVLKETAEITPPHIIQESIDPDGTCKWLLRLFDGNAIETVYIPEKNRGTLCVSSQVGCALNCDFCATGKQGFNRHLSVAEIIGQLWLAVQRFQVTNVVMMGMGEPLLNYEAVIAAMEWMLCDEAYGLSKYRVTVSTAGILPKMLALKNDLPVSLAVSLHAPNNALRDRLVPINKKYPLELLIPVCRDYFPKKSKQKVLFEYVLLDGVNDSLKEAEGLVRLLEGVRCKINLIPFNPFPGSLYKTASEGAILAFQNRLIEAGFQSYVRRQRGDEIAAACGQLVGNFQDRTRRSSYTDRLSRCEL